MQPHRIVGFLKGGVFLGNLHDSEERLGIREDYGNHILPPFKNPITSIWKRKSLSYTNALDPGTINMMGFPITSNFQSTFESAERNPGVF